MTRTGMTETDGSTQPPRDARRPRFKPHFQVQVLEPDLVYLLSETRRWVLNGKLYCRLAPLLNGDHSVEEIVDRLGASSRRVAVDLALARLVGRGFVTYDFIEQGPEAAFWSLVGTDPGRAAKRIASATVHVVTAGDAASEPLVKALQLVGITAFASQLEDARPSSLVAVVTDDYLTPDLAEINDTMLARRQPWMLLKPQGVVLWVGPVLVPGATACWACLALRLMGNRPIEAFIRGQLKDPRHCAPTSLGSLAATRGAGIQLAVTEMAKWLAWSADGKNPDSGLQDEPSPSALLLNRLVTLDTANLDCRSHSVVRRPQCPVCGSPTDPAGDPEPVSLSPRRKVFTWDGGHRSLTPVQTRRKYEYHLSPVTGIVNWVYPLSDDSEDLLHCYQSVVPFGIAREYRKTSDVLHRRCHGKGKTAAQAWASAFCEGVERYSALFSGETETFRKGRISDMGGDAVHPNELLLFSDTQYEQRESWNRSNPGDRYWIPRPFHEAEVIDWTPTWSLTHHRFRYIPTSLCYFAAPDSGEEPFAVPDSNGLAAGNNLEEAILQGLLEVIERDSFALWWYNRAQRPLVDLASFGDPFLDHLRLAYRKLQRELWVLDVTSDLGVPTFVALSRRVEDDLEAICLGCGTHVDPHIAVLRAVTEMNQCTVATDMVDWKSDSAHTDPLRIRWMRETRVADNPHLAPSEVLPPTTLTDFPYRPQEDLLVDIRNLVDLLSGRNLETMVLDLTKPDIGMSVARVIVPGLRPYLRRLAPGRLYEVPAALGWIPEALPESEMNPMPMFL